MRIRYSTADWNKRIPRDYAENLVARKRVLLAAEDDLGYQKALRHMCKHDILAYINLFVWQFNPKKKGQQIGPFITWGFQEDTLLARPETWDGDVNRPERGIIWCYEHDRTAVVEKSREMGASWLFLIFQDWLGLFHDHLQTLNISKSADAVDCKSPDSLFWKLRFMHAHLPRWLCGEIVEERMYIEYKRTKSYSTGEASTGRAGVGGRAAVIFIDEFSQVKEDIEVRQRTAGTADCRFFNGTHLGTDTEFFRLTQSPEIAKIVMHWSQHPDKRKGLYRYDPVSNQIEVLDKEYQYPEGFFFVKEYSPTGGPYPGIRSPWYDQKCKDIGEKRGVAMELDINPEGSVSQFIDNPVMILNLIGAYCRLADWTGNIEYEPDSGRPIRLASSHRGPLRLWCHVTPDGKVVPGLYKVGGDISSGTGATNSCLSVVNARTGEKVGEFCDSRLLPDKFAYIAVALCWLFKSEDNEPAELIWEKIGPGAVFGAKVFELGFRNVYHHTLENTKKRAAMASTVAGWQPTPENKRILLEQYRAALTARQYLNHSEEALREFFQFRYTREGTVEHSGIQSRDDPSGARGNHGDRVIADALGWRIAKTSWTVAKQVEQKEAPVLSLAWRRELWSKAKERDEDFVDN